MRKLTDILRLKHQAGLSHAKIAAALGLSKGVVAKYVSLANARGIAWPLPAGMDEAALERLLPGLADIDGIERVRVSYLQPAEMRESLIDVMTSTPGVVPYFDLSFQHASAAVLRRMR